MNPCFLFHPKLLEKVFRWQYLSPQTERHLFIVIYFVLISDKYGALHVYDSLGT